MSSWNERDNPEREAELLAIEQVERLKKDKAFLEKYIERRKRLFPLILLGGLIATAVSIIIFRDGNFFALALTYSLLLIGSAFYFKPTSDYQYRLIQIDNEIDLLNASVRSIEEKAEKLFRNHQFELKRYYDQTLKHSSQIFYVGLICILIGFMIIIGTIYLLAYQSMDIEFKNKIVIGSLSAIGNILTGYIGTIYLRMFSETINSLKDFHSRLVLTHNLHFSNFLLSKIDDKTKRTELIKDLAVEIAKK